MAEQNQEPKEGEEKFSLFKISEWPGFASNWFWRLPVIKRFRKGRKTIGERNPPIWYELRKIWFPKNKTLFETKLQTIEDFWTNQGGHLGSGGGTLLGNPDGIVKIYEELGAYFDIERLNSEVGFFEVGTGYLEENIDYGVPKDPKLWEEHEWGKTPDTKKKLETALTNQKGVPLQRRIKLIGSTIYHENKKEFKEDLYCFGYTTAEALSKRLTLYNRQFNLQAFQRYKVQVALRTRTGSASQKIIELIGKIAEVEEKIYRELETLVGMADTYYTKWGDQVDKLSPEAKKIGVIRYPHTYRVIKQFHYLTHEEAIVEEIAISGRKVLEVEEDEEGTIKGAVDKHTIKREIIIKLKQEKNIYEEEEEKLKEDIKELKRKVDEINNNIAKGKINEEEEPQQLLIVKGYEKRIEMYEERINDIDNIINKQHIIEETTPKVSANEFWQRPEEVDYGLDENGYPLEIDPNTGEVLIDRWWSEIAQNDWQLETIALKAGGKEYLEKHLQATVEFYEETIKEVKKLRAKVTNARRDIRKIKDDRFHGHIDLLELGTIIYSGWDSFRDDLRDGRYHKHSKSVGDYVIEGEGGFDDKFGAPFQKAWVQLPGEIGRRKGFYMKRRGVINVPITPIGINLDVENRDNIIKATPDWFNKKLPFDERNITQDYTMRLHDGTFTSGIRRPTKYNPAFDRRAQNLDFVYWGRMYYYRWSGEINEWDENPFPHISTRGIALYIDYLVKSDVWDYNDAIKALKGRKFDYGVRGQGKYGEVNMASGEGVLQEN